MDQFTRKFGIVDKRTETKEIITAVYNALLVKGSVPGARNGIVIVRKSLRNNVKKGAK